MAEEDRVVKFRRQPLDPAQNRYYAVITPDGLFAVVLMVQYQSGCAAIGWKTTEAQGYQCVGSPQAAHDYLREMFGEVDFSEITPVRYRSFLAALRPRAVAERRQVSVTVVKRGARRPVAPPIVVSTPPVPPPSKPIRRHSCKSVLSPVSPPPPVTRTPDPEPELIYTPPRPEPEPEPVYAPPEPPPKPELPRFPLLRTEDLPRTVVERYRGRGRKRR